MTIKEFAILCGCNAQTLRYYDRINLLKPSKVDKWSRYRLYDEAQALIFIKIKNLQLAGFSINEIKSLLEKTDNEIYNVLNNKILEEEKKLNLIKQIQKSYQSEMEDMKKKIAEIRSRINEEMIKYDPSEEFGISKEEYEEIMQNTINFFEKIAQDNNYEDYHFEEFKEDDKVMEDHYDYFENPNYGIVYEKHDFKYVKEFINDCLKLDEGEYHYVFKLIDEKKHNLSFSNIVLGLALKHNKDSNKKRNLSCTITNSLDNKNHFYLLKKHN